MVEKIKLSYSRINLFAQCNRKHFYREILNLPEKPSINLVYGAAAHDVLEQCNIARMAKRKEPTRTEIEYIAYDSIMDMLPSKEHEIDVDDTAKDVAILTHKWTKWKRRSPTPIAAEEWARKDFGQATFRGRIDAILDENTIVEYKTSNWGWKKDAADLETQGEYYSWLLGKPLTVIYEILVKKKKSFQRRVVTVDAEAHKIAEEEMIWYLRNRDSTIRNRKNWCDNCEFKDPCLKNVLTIGEYNDL